MYVPLVRKHRIRQLRPRFTIFVSLLMIRSIWQEISMSPCFTFMLACHFALLLSSMFSRCLRTCWFVSVLSFFSNLLGRKSELHRHSYRWPKLGRHFRLNESWWFTDKKWLLHDATHRATCSHGHAIHSRVFTGCIMLPNSTSNTNWTISSSAWVQRGSKGMDRYI